MWWRDPDRPVAWTKEGKLAYNDVQERDPILQELRETLRRLIREEPIDGVTNNELAEVCRAMNLRSKELCH